MPKLTPEQIERAREVCRALRAALDAVDGGKLSAAELPAVPPVKLTVRPAALPSAEAAAAVARSRAARARFREETEFRRAASVVLAIAAEAGRVLAPSILGRLLVLVLVVSVALCAPVGCTASPGAVQVGPTDQPAVQANVASPRAVVAPVRVDSRSATSQPAATAADANQAAGRDARQTTTTVNVSGSAWPIVGVVALLAAGVAAVAYIRAEVRRRDESQTAGNALERAAGEHRTLAGNAVGVAGAIAALGPGPQRDRLLAMIGERLDNRLAWDGLLERHQCRVSKRTADEAAARAS